jgi:hypothetical protein
MACTWDPDRNRFGLTKNNLTGYPETNVAQSDLNKSHTLILVNNHLTSINPHFVHHKSAPENLYCLLYIRHRQAKKYSKNFPHSCLQPLAVG